MAKALYYSPRLKRDLISPLYHAAKSQGIPMTALASRLGGRGAVAYRGGGDVHRSRGAAGV